MSRQSIFAATGLTILILASSFAIASYALAQDTRPQLRANLPVAALPTMALDEATTLQVNNLIGTDAAARFGITPASYAAARRLADTKVGTFYLIPGTRGACIVMRSSVGCGDPGAPGQPMLASAHATPEGDSVVGVGVATAGTESVSMPARTLSGVISFPVSKGLFHIDARVSFESPTGPVLIGK